MDPMGIYGSLYYVIPIEIRDTNRDPSFLTGSQTGTSLKPGATTGQG